MQDVHVLKEQVAKHQSDPNLYQLKAYHKQQEKVECLALARFRHSVPSSKLLCTEELSLIHI